MIASGAHLLEGIRIEQNPAKLDDLRRVLGHVYTMLVTGGRDVDHDVTIDGEGRDWLLRRHDAKRRKPVRVHGEALRPGLQARKCLQRSKHRRRNKTRQEPT